MGDHRGRRVDTTTKRSLIERVADATGQKRSTVRRTVQMFLDEIMADVERGCRIEFREFGVFEIRRRAARMAQNPKTLERVRVPAKHTVRFKMGLKMRQHLERAEAAGVVVVPGDNGSVRVRSRGRAGVGV